MDRIWKVLTRKKVINPVTAEETRLGRVLNVFDLTALGVGSTLGVGLFILAGQVARDTAGPSVVLSFVLAAIASVFAGLCYAEFGARVPRAGSAYIYSYVCVGEFIAFVIGWNLILEYIIGSASVARGISIYIDSLCNNTMQNAFKEIVPINVPYFSSYFDFFSFALSVVVSVGLAFGLKESSMVNNIVTVLNILVVIFIVIAGSLKADVANWQVPANISTNSTNSTNIGEGGFFPFGVEGMIKGAATCFYAFIGFDCIATTGEEVSNPRKAIPISILTSLFIVFLAYFGVSTVLTLMVPYYLQDRNAPILKAFEAVGFNVAMWIIAVGAIFGLLASLFGAIFPLPRIIYAMASDGLIFKFLAKVSPRFKSPLIGTILAGLLTGLMSALFDIGQLINMMSIGTLQAYTMVAASVLILRYNDNEIRQPFDGLTNDERELISSTESSGFCSYLWQFFNCRNHEPNRISENIIAFEVLIYCVFCIGISLCLKYLNVNILNGELWSILITSILVGLAILLLISLATQPKSRQELSFKVPLIPLIPAISIIINIYLMVMLDSLTWIRFGVWMAIGVPMYCACACTRKPSQKPLNDHYHNNITNETYKDPNGGISNPSFLTTEHNGHPPKSYKKKVAAPPPPTICETLEVQQEAAIAQLDEVLDKEAAILQLNDTLLDDTVRVRRLSIDSLSNASTIAMRSEDVIADVHCANVFTPVAGPVCFNVLNRDANVQLAKAEFVSMDVVHVNQSDDMLPKEKEQDTNLDPSIEVTAGKFDETVEEAIENYPIEKNLMIDPQMGENFDLTGKNTEEDREPLNRSKKFNSSALNEVVKSEEGNNLLESSILEIEIVDRNPFVSKDSLFTSDKARDSNLDNSIESSTASNVVNPKILQSPSTISEVEQISDNKPLFCIAPLAPLGLIVSSAMPTEEALKTVTLRHVQRQINSIDSTENDNPSEHNLRVGSEEYKQFIKSLDGKLKRLAILPTYYAPRSKKNIDEAPKPVKMINNENIIDDHIDQAKAKERLNNFLTKNSDERLGRKLQASVSVVDYTTPSKLISEKSEEESYSDIEAHRNKMESVFKGIMLKKTDGQGEDYLKRRLSKSLGSSFVKVNDQADHKVKMNDIFEDIKSLRKSSIK